MRKKKNCALTNEHVIDLSSLLLLLHNPVKQLVKGWSSKSEHPYWEEVGKKRP